MKRTRASGAILYVLTWALLARCGEKPDAAAAETPQLEVRATVAPAQTASAVASVDGRVTALLVEEGQSIQAGTTVATITNAGIDRDIAYAKAQVAVAEHRLRDARRPLAQSLILGDSGARERASAEILKNAESKRDRYRDLFRTHDISKQELEDAESGYAAALRDWLVERERASQKVIQTDSSILQLELERAKAELAFASERRALLVVNAPISGVVTRVAARVGESIFPRDPIVDISNNTKVEVRGVIASELTRYVRAGMPVETKVFTVPPRRFTVPIKSVLPGSGGATLIVELPNPDGVLQEGQTAVVTVK
ncbi:MAG TPA: efflux RND transporter periplasmic adaptor subunit [Thermoanaerobaculia bacterium]|nr:efflux RND transporter periplasmic adaptor subunit [Thermoanaerobaculia bacterium]